MMESANIADPGGWRARNPLELIDHLEQTHHHYLRSELPRITELHRRVTRAYAWEYPELVTIGDLFEELRLDLEPHVAKEERVLFPLVRRLLSSASRPVFDCGSISNPISVMLREHEENRDRFRLLNRAAQGYAVPEGASDHHRALLAALSQLECDTEVHHRKENEVLFPAVVQFEARLAA